MPCEQSGGEVSVFAISFPYSIFQITKQLKENLA